MMQYRRNYELDKEMVLKLKNSELSIRRDHIGLGGSSSLRSRRFGKVRSRIRSQKKKPIVGAGKTGEQSERGFGSLRRSGMKGKLGVVIAPRQERITGKKVLKGMAEGTCMYEEGKKETAR